jgi:hypothetical protein
LIFSSLESTLQAAATAIGSSATDVGKAVANIPIQTNISLQGLTGTALTTALNSVLSATTDKIVNSLISQNLLPNLSQFAQVGEGYLTTLVRVATGVEQANVAMQGLGLTAVSFTDIVNKQGDIATEIERQTIVAAQTVTTETTQLFTRTGGLSPQLRLVTNSVVSGIGQIIQAFTGSAADMVTLYQNLLSIQKAMNDVALNGNSLTSAMIQGAGGTSQLSSGLSDYLKDFFSPAEQSAAEMKDLNAQFTALGLKMPATKDGFRQLVASIDTSTTGGQTLVGKLLNLSGAFSDAVDHANALQTASTGAADAMSAITQQMDQVGTLQKSLAGSLQTVAQNGIGYDMGAHLDDNVNTAQTAFDGIADDTSSSSLTARISAASDLQNAIMASYNYQYSALQTQVQAQQQAYQAAQQAANQLSQTFKSLGTYAQSLLTSELSPLSNQQKLAASQQQYQTTLAAAQNGDATAAKALQNDANNYLTQSRSYYASGSQYDAIFQSVQQALSSLGSRGDASVSSITQAGFQMSADLQKQLNDLQTKANDQLTGIQDVTKKWQADLQKQLADQATAVVAIPTALATITASLNTLDTRIGAAVAAALAQQAINIAAQQAANTAAHANTGASNVSAPDKTGGPGPSRRPNIKDADATMQLDGSHADGLERVPFDGYRAELHEGEGVIDAPAMAAIRRYFNAPAPSRSASNDGATIAALNEQVRQLQALVTLHSAGYQALLARLDRSNSALDGIKKKAVLAAAK